jgi:hypothetical protein
MQKFYQIIIDMANWTYTGADQNQTYFGDINRGYAVQQYNQNPGPSIDPSDPAILMNGQTSSAQFTDQDGDTLDLWLTTAQMSFQVQGAFSQSARLREFFPKNLVQAKWILQGICPNSFQYQRLAQFVRKSQLAVLNQSSLGANQLLRLDIFGTTNKQVYVYNGKFYATSPNPRAKKFTFNVGKQPHAPQIAMYGYVPNSKRGAQKFVFAPTYQMEFMVCYSYGTQNVLITENGALTKILDAMGQNTTTERSNLSILNDLGAYGALNSPGLSPPPPVVV